MSLRCDVICALAYCGRHESSHIIKAHKDCTDFIWLSLWVRNLTDGQTLPNPPLGRAYQLLNRLNKKVDSTKVGMREFDFVIVLIRGNLWQKKSLQKNICVIREIRGSKTNHEFVSFGVTLWVRQHFNPSRIYSNIDSIFLGVMTL